MEKHSTKKYFSCQLIGLQESFKKYIFISPFQMHIGIWVFFIFNLVIFC